MFWVCAGVKFYKTFLAEYDTRVDLPHLSCLPAETAQLYWLYLGLKLSSKHVDVSAASQHWPLFVQPVSEGKRRHHVHGVQLEGRLSEDFICQFKDKEVCSGYNIQALFCPSVSRNHFRPTHLDQAFLFYSALTP